MNRHMCSLVNEGRRSEGAISAFLPRAVKLCVMALALVGISLGNCALSEAGDAKKPNIVFILTDDHRWDFMSCAGHPFVKTPSLDRLASQGVLFSNAFVTSSLCSPSRASFLTGLYAHTHGVQNNLTPWRDDNVTFLELFKKAGYDTAFIGKWHMPGRLPKLRGIDLFVTFTIQGGQGRYWKCPLIVNGTETASRKPYITEELTDLAIEFVARERENPFCLYLSHKAVHHDWSPPEDLADLYADVRVSYPKESDAWVTTMDGSVFAGTFGILDRHYKNYCRVVVDVDRNVGRFLKKLDDLGLAENTIVVYAGDNGFFWGEHRLVDKRWAYEESIRIPFIVRCPWLIKDPGRRANQTVLNIDLAPSLLEAAGLPVPENVQGESFVPILKSDSAQGRKVWLYEYFKDFPYNVPGINAVRTRTHMYMEYAGRKTPELYNVASDPHQKRNLINTDEGLRALPELKKALEDLKKGKKL
jgi:N-acetylglucosamine-6-sulfatase